ncbi:LamB/YcsF family protein [Alteribacillus sp. JSM 102045]|uniref:LamB/YcsF family protein n=1 Tax=Alteribacillus sp. JSM 102045 TaxID=1562101 RepID=UPI0035BF7707
MSFHVDLNCDLGESFGAYKIGEDSKVLDLVTSANIACGYHAGDHNIMAETVAMAKRSGTAVGAHPGFPDLAGFGRRNMHIDPDEVYRLVIYQVGALYGFCQAKKMKMQHVKPHGALFNMASKDAELAQAIAAAVHDVNPDLILFGLSGSELTRAGEKRGLQVAHEVFADRTYQPDGTLTPRTRPNAIIHSAEEAAEHVLHMITHQQIRAVDGTVLDKRVDTICVHGDNPESLLFVKKLRSMLQDNQVIIKAVGN